MKKKWDKQEKDNAVWDIIDRYESGDITKDEAYAELLELNHGNEDEAKADLELVLAKKRQEEYEEYKEYFDYYADDPHGYKGD